MKVYLAVETNIEDKTAADMVNRESLDGVSVFQGNYDVLRNTPASSCKWVYMGYPSKEIEMNPELWFAFPTILAYDNKGRFLVAEHKDVTTNLDIEEIS